jgi:hypothetical protein
LNDERAAGEGPLDPERQQEEPAPSAPEPVPPPGGVTEGGYSYTVVEPTPPAETPAPKPRRERQPVHIGPFVLAAIIVVPALIAGAAAWFIASALDGGGGGGDRTNANVASVINAFSQGQGGTTQRIEGALPAGLPEDIPSYPGAHVVSSLVSVSGEDAVYLVIYDTTDSLEEVGAHFTEALGEDPWQLDGAQDARETSLRQFTKIDDADVEGLYLIAESKNADLTTIFLSVQVTSGADAAELEDFEPRASKTLPDGFPSAVPQYPDAVVIETGFQKQPDGTRYSVSAITRDGQSGTLQYFRDAFEDQGWTVEDTDASQAGLENAEAITFEAEGGDLTGNVVVGDFPEDRNYRRIDLNVFEP